MAPEEARVATSFSGTAASRRASRSAGISFLKIASRSAAPSGDEDFQASNWASHSAASAFFSAMRSDRNPRTSSGTTKDCSGSNPRAALVAFSSSSPRGAPWLFAVPARWGEPNPMVVSPMMMVGLSLQDWASVTAASICLGHWPLILRTFQPYASKRAPTSSLIARLVLPSMVILFES